MENSPSLLHTHRVLSLSFNIYPWLWAAYLPNWPLGPSDTILQITIIAYPQGLTFTLVKVFLTCICLAWLHWFSTVFSMSHRKREGWDFFFFPAHISCCESLQCLWRSGCQSLLGSGELMRNERYMEDFFL